MEKELFNLTNPQKSILLTEEFYKGTNINNICGTAIIEDIVNFDLLKKAMNIFVKNHDSFNMKLILDNNEIKQYLDDITDIDVEVVELASKDDISKLENTMLNHVFDIYNGDLFAMKIFKLQDNSGGFIVNVHHLFGDSWSLGIVANDIVRIYSCLLNGEEITNDNYSYIDYIYSEKEYLESAKYIKDKEYWHSIFNTIPEQATIPSHLPEVSGNFDCKACRKMFNIDNKLMDKITDFCKLNRVSVFNFFMAVYSIYIGRVSNLDDFVIGTPILNRTNFKEKNTTGMFINTAPLRVNIDSGLSFKSFVENIAKDSLGMLRHQKYYYQNILEDLRKDNPNLPNLYNVLISYQITNANVQRDVNYSTCWSFNGNIGDDIDIHLFDLNGTGSINIAYDYKVSKYEETDISDMHERILHIIWQILERDNVCLKDIEIVTAKEKYDILYKFNSISSDFLDNDTIIELFEKQVQICPDKTAAVFYDTKLTYRELNEKANKLANYLLSYSIKNEDVIAIFLDKSLEMIVSMLAILKVGACYLPVDINYPKSRINYMLKDSNVKLILASTSTSSLIDTNINILNMDENFYEECSNVSSFCNTTSSNLAYIMYTSGSTGNPKGVMIEQKSIIRLVKDSNFISFNDNDRILQTGSIVFDACTFEIWASLLNGLELYIIKKDDLLTISSFDKFLHDNKISILWLTAPLFNQICEQNPTVFNNVRCLLTGGDVLSCKHINMVKNANPNLTVINGYGPTENTTFSCCFTVNDTYTTSIPIGKPITNSSCYVVSKSGNLQPANIPGELWVGGHGVARGYLNNNNLTEEKFIKNPFGDGVLYKTGDLVKWLSDGNIEFIGRIDNQVKIRGFRVELNEINSKILQFPNIKESTTLITSNNNDKFICAYVVFKSNNDVSALKDFLKTCLPSYMIPTFIIPLSVLPINTNGKVDKHKLPEIDLYVESENIIELSTPTQHMLAKIWKDILNINMIGANYNFFEIGGDSLLAIKLSAHISSNFKVNLSVSDIFKYPVLSDLANYLDSCTLTQDIFSIKKCNQLDYYPLSSAQKRIYYASILDTNSTLYNIAGGIIVNKLLDVNKLQDCLNTLINRHDALRTHFTIQDDEVVQIINNRIDFKLDLETSNTDNLNDIYSNFVQPFNLSNAPLFRAKLVNLNNNRMLFLIDMHHIISDGTSLSILLQELCDLYNGNTLPEKQIDYKDFALWENEQFNKDEFNNLKNFWLNQFKDEIPLLNMPTTYARPSVQSFEGCNYHTILSKDIFEKINTVSKSLGITPYMLMLSCYYILLSKYSSQDDIIVGTPIVGRELSELSNMLGMFVNTLALRSKVDSSVNFANFANLIKDYCLDCFGHQSYPFDKLVKELNIKRDTSRNPLFDVMFIYQNNGYPKIDFKGTNVEYFIPDNNVAKFDLTLEVIPVNDEYSIRFEYCTKLFDEDFIKRLSSHYINILNAVLKNTNIKIADIDMLSEDEKNQILYDFNNTKMDYPCDKTIAELFEEQVEKTPDNIAVVFEDKKLTYKELNEKANSLAWYLKENNIGRDNIIAISMERSLEVLICMLAILKTGAAYLPIDPTYPNSRIEYIIKDSAVKMLLTKDHLLQNFKNIPFTLSVDLTNCIIYNTYPTKNLNTSVNPNDLAYLIYTSGSTGNPKGVMITNRNVNNFTSATCQKIQFNKYSSIVSVTTMCFDIFVLETLLPLEYGLTIVLANDVAQNMPALLNEICLNNNVEMLQTTPSKMELLISNNSSIEYVKHLKCIMLGGEPLNEIILAKLKKLTKAKIYNMYGPTETTVWSTIKDMTNTDNITIGRPIGNTQVYILDKALNPVPIGVSGELYIAGSGVTNGYLNRNTLTKEKFILSPFNNNSIIYNTGDLASWNDNGEINCLGRADFQVKIRGLRIELGEIEKQILQYPDINNAVVCVKSDQLNRDFLCGYFTSKSRISISELKDYLGKFLPNYMIPTFLIQLKDFKYTPNAKIDRKALPMPKINNNNSIITAETPNEVKILDIFENLLGISPISITDNFFEIGGDSILALKLQVELLNNNIDISYADIFKYNTVKDLALKIDSDNSKPVIKDNNYDTNLNEILKLNSLEYANLDYKPLQNVLLPGATGFLGAHILDNLLTNTKANIYCLVRKDTNISVMEKFLNRLHYYFGNKYDGLIDNRIFVIESDVTKENLGLSDSVIKKLFTSIQCVINSVAIVKHYGYYSEFERINVNVVKNLVKYCKEFHKKFIQISTISVSGNTLTDLAIDTNSFESDVEFDENCLNIAQSLENIYVRSKYEAEKFILQEIYYHALDALILRIGNITNRFSDGLFQPNKQENAFMHRIKALIEIKAIPENLLENYCEFSPVDCVADAVVHAIQYVNKPINILHIYNQNHVLIKDLLQLLSEYNIKIISNNAFRKLIKDTLIDAKSSKSLSYILNDFDKDFNLVYDSRIKIKNDFSKHVLSEAGFNWPIIDKDYIDKLLKNY